MRIPVVCTVLALGVVGCHGTSSFVSGGGLSSVRTGVPDAPPCNDLEQQGAAIDLVASSVAAPKAVGGRIEDGIYVLSRSTLHTKDSSPGAKLLSFGRITMVVNGETSQLVKTGADGHVRRTTVKRESSGTVTISRTLCASPTATEGPDSASTEYTATSNSVQFITRGPAGTVVANYAKLAPPQASISLGLAPEAGATAWESASVMTSTLR